MVQMHKRSTAEGAGQEDGHQALKTSETSLLDVFKFFKKKSINERKRKAAVTRM